MAKNIEEEAAPAADVLQFPDPKHAPQRGHRALSDQRLKELATKLAAAMEPAEPARPPGGRAMEMRCWQGLVGTDVAIAFPDAAPDALRKEAMVLQRGALGLSRHCMALDQEGVCAHETVAAISLILGLSIAMQEVASLVSGHREAES